MAEVNDKLFIHIDDDPLIRYTWEQQAISHDINIRSFSNFENARQEIVDLPLEAYFFIDQDLGEGHKKGDQSLLELYELGYRNLFLTTGHSKEDFESSKFKVLGKDFPKIHL